MNGQDTDLESVFLLASDPAALNQALYLVTHGLYILTAATSSRLNGQCLDALMQVTNVPPRVAIGVNQRSLTHEMIATTGRFGVNVLDRENPRNLDLIKHFGFQSGRTIDKFATLPHLRAQSGVPILPDAKAFYECQVLPEMTLNLGTHTLFIGSVEQAGTRDKGEPLTYNEYRSTMRRRSER
jgi:flavin reductase (DIM6/NTAB) family NADH-FMN oxidoreductase RutF